MERNSYVTLFPLFRPTSNLERTERIGGKKKPLRKEGLRLHYANRPSLGVTRRRKILRKHRGRRRSDGRNGDGSGRNKRCAADPYDITIGAQERGQSERVAVDFGIRLVAACIRVRD
jgi:hypothetical protein